MTVERAFGRLKGRYRILLKRIDVLEFGRVAKIITACMVLHNFVERRNTAPDLNIPPDFVDPGLAHGARSGGAERVRGAKAVREGYVQYAQEHCGWWKRTHAATRSVPRVHQPPTRLPGMGGANQKEDDMWE